MKMGGKEAQGEIEPKESGIQSGTESPVAGRNMAKVGDMKTAHEAGVGKRERSLKGCTFFSITLR